MMNRSGQNLIEYTVLLAIVIIVLIVTLGPSGFYTKMIDESLNAAIDAIKTESSSYNFN